MRNHLRRPAHAWSFGLARRFDLQNSESLIQCLNLAPEIQNVVAETIDVLQPVWRQSGQDFLIDNSTFSLEFLQNPAHPNHVVQDDQIGYEMVVLDDLALFMAQVFGNHPFSAEKQFFLETVELLRLVGFRMDESAKFDVANVFQQEHGSDYFAEFLEGEIQLVLSTVSSQATQDGRGGNFSELDGNCHAQHVRQMGLDHLPVDVVAEKPVDMRKFLVAVGPMEHQILDATDARHQFDTQEVGKRKHRVALGLGVAMDSGSRRPPRFPCSAAARAGLPARRFHR